MEHLDKADIAPEAADFSPIEDTPVRTLSASMFLPKQSVWNFRREHRRRATAPFPTPGPLPRLVVGRNGLGVQDHGQGASTPPRVELGMVMRDQYALWDMISRDFGRQGAGPALMSGNTVIDERNFALM